MFSFGQVVFLVVVCFVCYFAGKIAMMVTRSAIAARESDSALARLDIVADHICKNMSKYTKAITKAVAGCMDEEKGE